MWSRNALTERLNLEYPILQAPMGLNSTPALAAAVAGSGGLGGLGMLGFSADEVERRIGGFRQMCDASLNVNYPLYDHAGDLSGTAMPMRARLQALYQKLDMGPMPEPQASAGGLAADHLAVLEKIPPEVVSFHFGLPDADIVQTLKGRGVFVISSATTVAEARALEAGGVDAVIAQGLEAGGHRATFSGVEVGLQAGLFALLPQVVDAVSVPVIAAGGIADGRAVAAAFMLGASAVQIGTAFLRCEEANVSDAYRVALAEGGDSATTVTEAISGLPARYIRNRLVTELEQDEPLPFPAQLDLVEPLGDRGDAQYTALFCGQSVALTRALPAAELVRTIAAETDRCLQAFAWRDDS